MKHKYVSCLSVSFYLLFNSGCSSITPDDPTGFGAWADDCKGIAVALNESDFDGGFLKGHSTNERCGLYLCDTNGTLIKPLFEHREIDGNPSSIDSISYNKSQDYLIVYSILYGTGKIRKEKVTISTGKIESLELIENGPDWPLISHYKIVGCNNKAIKWDAGKNWILIE